MVTFTENDPPRGVARPKTGPDMEFQRTSTAGSLAPQPVPVTVAWLPARPAAGLMNISPPGVQAKAQLAAPTTTAAASAAVSNLGCPLVLIARPPGTGIVRCRGTPSEYFFALSEPWP